MTAVTHMYRHFLGNVSFFYFYRSIFDTRQTSHNLKIVEQLIMLLKVAASTAKAE